MNKEELKPGMWVRTKEGIRKITEIQLDDTYDFLSNVSCDDNMPYFESEILKASLNKFDLIEEGDYINGHKVVYKDDEIIQVDCAGWIESDEKGWISYQNYEEDIKTIVTREQFKSIEYVFEEEL